MTHKVAVAIVHGVGRQEPRFHEPMADELTQRFAKRIAGKAADPATELVVRPVYWAPVLEAAERLLWSRISNGGRMDYVPLREFLIQFAADAIAYQPTPGSRDIYDRIHVVMAETLRELARAAGPTAPLVVVAHSLGTVISSNYLYDLESHPRRHVLPDRVRAAVGPTPLERGETFAGFYTMGSPVAIWSLRYPDFGVPIDVPSPFLSKHHPRVKGEWLNFYDKDDVIGYPLRTLNKAYERAVTKDLEINAGGPTTSWSPASHLEYWTDNDVTKPVAESLARIWSQANP